MDIAIIGGGLSGLTAAFYAKKEGHSVTLLETSKRVGGVVQSEETEGFLLEFGPNTVQMKADLYQLVHDLGLGSQMQLASHNTPRYIQLNNRLHSVPLSPKSLLFTSLLSISGKFRLLKEPWAPSHTQGGDETLHSFASRRLGDEVVNNLLAPFVSGVWAGDTRQLSASAFPKLVEWEKTYGSIFRGMMKNSSRESNVPKGLVSFQKGMGWLIEALKNHLEGNIKINSPVFEIRPQNGKWIVTGAAGDLKVDQVILSCPAGPMARMITPFAQEAAFTLNQTPYTSVAVLHLGFKSEQVGAQKQGFGFLCAPSEKSNILGCLWNSNLFPHRAPDGSVLWTVFMGGMTNPKIIEQPKEKLIALALQSLEPIMKLKGLPHFTRVTHIAQAIPQYTLGHTQRMKILDETEKKNPGLYFAANYRGGIAVGDVIKSAKQAIL